MATFKQDDNCPSLTSPLYRHFTFLLLLLTTFLVAVKATMSCLPLQLGWLYVISGLGWRMGLGPKLTPVTFLMDQDKMDRYSNILSLSLDIGHFFDTFVNFSGGNTRILMEKNWDYLGG